MLFQRINIGIYVTTCLIAITGVFIQEALIYAAFVGFLLGIYQLCIMLILPAFVKYKTYKLRRNIRFYWLYVFTYCIGLVLLGYFENDDFSKTYFIAVSLLPIILLAPFQFYVVELLLVHRKETLRNQTNTKQLTISLPQKQKMTAIQTEINQIEEERRILIF